MRNAPRPAPAVSVVRLTKLRPWSTAGVFFVVSFAFGLVLIAAAAMLHFAITEIGILAEIDSKIASVAGDSSLQLQEVVTLEKMVAVAAVIAALFTGLSPLMGLCFAGFYNAAAKLTGGIKMEFTSPTVTVVEPDPYPAADDQA